jgi:hypothetical protein
MSERRVFGNLKTRLSNKEIEQIHLSDIQPLVGGGKHSYFVLLRDHLCRYLQRCYLVFISFSRNYKNASRNDRFQQIEFYVFLHRSLY